MAAVESNNVRKRKEERGREKQRSEEKYRCEISISYLQDPATIKHLIQRYLPLQYETAFQSEVESEKKFEEYFWECKARLCVPKGEERKIEAVLGSFCSKYALQGWLQVNHPSKRIYFKELPQLPVIMPVEVSGGALASPTIYHRHWSLNISCVIQFDFILDKIEVLEKRDLASSKMTELFDISLRNCIKPLIMSKQESDMRILLYINLIIVPTLCQRLQSLNATDFGQTSCLCLSISTSNESESTGISELFAGLIFELKQREHEVVHASLQVIDFTTEEVQFPRNQNFSLIYAIRTLLSRGMKVTDKLRKEEMQKLFNESGNNEEQATEVIYQFAEACFHQPFFDVNTFLERVKNLSSSSLSERAFLPANHVMIYRIIVTPSRIILFPKEPVKLNRILRRYGHEHFLRVLFRDENFEKMINVSNSSFEYGINRIKGILRSGITIGDRRYEYLACSNSQLREHGFWFFSDNNGITADIIRLNAGDFSHERCVASYVARLGLCFSSSQETIDIPQRNVIEKPDIERNNYCFTDGIGKISESLADKAIKKLNLGFCPSAFQIRFGGCKGVLAVDPSMGQIDAVAIRPSMRKFSSESSTLEVLDYTKPKMLHLNRQVITLLCGLGVSENVIMALQEKMLLSLADILIYEDAAAKALSYIVKDIDVGQLRQCGFHITSDPFFRSLLKVFYQNKLVSLMKKAKIQVPIEKGRLMMGTVDETNALDYGEVFIQYSTSLDERCRHRTVHRGPVVLTKNPCFHPGDLRIFNAVDIPGLHHMVDCITFPQKGQRPHPNEMAGSDLDGDLYFVCWDPELLPPKANQTPMDFPKVEKKCLPNPVTTNDVIEFLGNYIANDRLGMIANAHVVHADKKDIFSNECIELARIHSDAVDFPKTGKVPTLPKNLTIDCYPDFMMKKDAKHNLSEKVLGKLFRQCKKLQIFPEDHTAIICEDSDLLYHGYEDYLESAKGAKEEYDKSVKQLLGQYGFQNEAHLIVGFDKAQKKSKGILEKETFEVSQIAQSQYLEIRRKIRESFFVDLHTSGSHFDLEKKKKASAWYAIAYSTKYRDEHSSIFGLPWTVSDILMEIKSGKRAQAAQIKSNFCADQKLALKQISDSIVKLYSKRATDEPKTQDMNVILKWFIVYWARDNDILRENDLTEALLRRLLRNYDTNLFNNELSELLMTFLQYFHAAVSGRQDLRHKHSLVLQPEARRNISDKIIFAYRQISLNLTVDVLLHDQEFEDDIATIDIPYNIIRSVLFSEDFVCTSLSKETGADIVIESRVRNRNIRMQITAYGTTLQLRKLSDVINSLGEASSRNPVEVTANFAYIYGGIHHLFEGSESEEDEINFVPYLGRKQTEHKNQEAFLPLLKNTETFGTENSYTLRKVLVSACTKLRDIFHRPFHGSLYMAITFGTIYVYGTKEFTDVKTIEHLNNTLYRRSETDSRQRRYRKGKREPFLKSSFLPDDCYVTNVENFLTSRNFVASECKIISHVTLEFEKRRYLLVLNEKCCISEIRRNDLKWVSADIVRKEKVENLSSKKLDIRFKIQSKRMLDQAHLQNDRFWKAHVDEPILQYSDLRVRVRDFGQSVKFIRRKNIRHYKYSPGQGETSTTPNLMSELHIDVSNVTEYSDRASDGEFKESDTRTEVSISPMSFRLDQSDADVESLVDFLWRFSSEMASAVE